MDEIKIIETQGVVLRQKTQMGEALVRAAGVPCEKSNKYRLSYLPAEKNVGRTPSDPERWKPRAEELEALDAFLFVREKSGCFTRIALSILGWVNLRPLKLHFGLDEISGDAFVVKRDFNCGGALCCNLKMDVFNQSSGEEVRIGRVRENFEPYLSKCCAQSCYCTSYHDIETCEPGAQGNAKSDFEKKYTLVANISCCGPHNNCCGATCCKNDMVFDIVDTNDQVVGYLQKTYAPGPGCCDAFCRMTHMYNNYLLEFPKDSTVEERMLLITAMFQLDFQCFETKGNE